MASTPDAPKGGGLCKQRHRSRKLVDQGRCSEVTGAELEGRSRSGAGFPDVQGMAVGRWTQHEGQ